jgi:hypothetical protein
MDDKAISIAAAFARCLCPSHFDVSVPLGCKPFPWGNILAVADDMINRDSKLADKEGRNKSKNYKNQIKNGFAKFRTHTRTPTKTGGHA